MVLTASYQRPCQATLIVRTEDGEEWEATEEDLRRFKLAKPSDLYRRAIDLLCEAAECSERDLGRVESLEALNDVRYTIECALLYDHSPWADADGTPWDREDADSSRAIKARLKALFNPGPSSESGA